MQSNEQPIELNSVKLPYIPTELIKYNNGKGLIEIGVRVESKVSEPTHTILLQGLLAKHSLYPDKCLMRKKSPEYRVEKVIARPPLNIEELYNDTLQEQMNLGFAYVYVKFITLTYLINEIKYKFMYDSPNSANVLKYIDDKPIGKMSIAKQNKLLAGDLKFCLPSHCELKYKQVRVCYP